jgi:translation initiation factor IF-3
LIQASQLRVIDEEGRQLGVMTKGEALRAAEEAGLDLVEISPDASPPVAKIVDWGKFNYQRTKQLQKNKRNVKVVEIKQMRFGLKIGENDLAVKLRKVTGFLEAGHKVKIGVWYKGREMAHQELGYKLATKVIDMFGDGIVVEQPPMLAGRQLSFVIRGTGKPVAPKETEE